MASQGLVEQRVAAGGEQGGLGDVPVSQYVLPGTGPERDEDDDEEIDHGMPADIDLTHIGGVETPPAGGHLPGPPGVPPFGSQIGFGSESGVRASRAPLLPAVLPPAPRAPSPTPDIEGLDALFKNSLGARVFHAKCPGVLSPFLVAIGGHDDLTNEDILSVREEDLQATSA
jgi:hypothetical protein